jgi:predicted GNAT superfamily acetyltransferase
MDIRPIRGIDEYRAVEDLQKEIWQIDDREIVPAVHMIPACEVGAILVGAFDGGDLVGFVYGFPGLEHGHPIIHSDMLAVRSSYRDRGLGRKLKFAQRDHALARGIDRITWTFDPLQSRNAHLNLNILGATADRYLRDFYGQTSSPLHSGGTDRLWVTWDLKRHPVSSGGASRRIAVSADRAALRSEFEDAFGSGFIAVGFEDNAYVLKESAAT